MAKKRVPNYHPELKISKSPKISENPAQYKDFPVAWQLSFIDDDSKWGTKCFLEHTSFGNYDNLLDEFDNIHNDLYDAVNSLIGKKFNGVVELLEAVEKKANNNITAEEQRVILKYLDENPFWSEIYTKIRHFETNTWHIIERERHGKKGKSKHHYISISDIISTAQKRLQKLDLDDVDQLFSIRLKGKLRIWGIRTFSYFKVLWFDFNHEICPSQRN